MRRYLLLRDDPPQPNLAASMSLLDGAMKVIQSKPPDPNVVPPVVTPAPAPSPAAAPVVSTTPPPAPAPAKPTIDLGAAKQALGTTTETPPAPISDVTLEAYEKGLPESERAKFNKHVRLELKRIPALEAELTKLRTNPQTPANDDAIKAVQDKLAAQEATNKALESRLAMFDLKATSAYQQKFKAPQEALTKQIKDVLAGFAVDEPEAVLTEALSKTGAEMIAVLKDKATPAMPTLYPLITKLQEIQGAATEAEKNAALHLQQMTEQQKINNLAQMKQQRDTLYAAALMNRQTKGDFLLRELPGNEPWNKEVSVIREMGKTIGESNDPGMQANAFLMAAQFPVLQDLFFKLNEAHTALQKEYTALTGKVPTIGAAPAIASAPVNDGKGMSGTDAAKSILAQLKMG